jgi:hypothetical protein
MNWVQALEEGGRNRPQPAGSACYCLDMSHSAGGGP